MARIEFEALIQRRAIDENLLPVRLKNKIREYRKLQAAVADLDAELAQPGINAERKIECEQTKAQSEQVLQEMDQEIVAYIDKWHKEKDKRLAAAKRTKEFNDRKKGAQPTPEPEPEPAPAPEPEPAPQPAPEPEPGPVPVPSPAPVPGEPEEKKRKISTGGWIAIIAVGALTLGVGGVALARHMAQRNAGG